MPRASKPKGGLKKAAIMAFIIPMGGCFGIDPVTYTSAKLAIDGISYLATGKGTTDHAISVAVGQDCNMLRVFSRERAICEQWTDDTTPTIATASGPTRELAQIRQRQLREDPQAYLRNYSQQSNSQSATLSGTGNGNDGTPYFSLWAPQHDNPPPTQ